MLKRLNLQEIITNVILLSIISLNLKINYDEYLHKICETLKPFKTTSWLSSWCNG